jgi:hypothetical protein
MHERKEGAMRPSRMMVSLTLAVSTLLIVACGGTSPDEADADGDTDAVGDADAVDGVDAVDATDTRVDTGIDVGPDGCVDVDRDGHCRPEDCDDEDASVNPGADEACGNGIDDDCDGDVDEGCLDGTDTYFVDADSIGGTCSDSGPGTRTQPWCTVDKANDTLEAGDTVYIRAGTYTNETIQPVNAGLSETQRITYAAYEDEVVTFEDSVYCVRIQGTDYVTVLGIEFHDCERNLYIDGSSHVNVGYCEFDNPGGPVTWAGSRIYHDSTYNRIYNCVFSRYGMQSGSAGSYDDSGCILDIGNDNEVDRSDHNLVVNSTFFYGGHHILGVYANNNVVRGNTFHNEEWYACHRTALGGLCGNRNVILNTSDPTMNVRNVIEDNIIAFSGVPPDQDSSTGLSVRTQLNIIRRNVLYHNDASGLGLSADGGNFNDPSGNHIYSNVFFHNGYPAADDWDPLKCGLMLARWVDDSAHNPMTGVAIKNNVFHDNQMYAVYFYYVDETEQDVATNWEEEGDPGFVSISGTADPFDFGVFDFHLATGSPCIDAGGYLTLTSDDGADATVIGVEDTGYFSDGEGLVGGDMIQLEGQDIAVTVTGVDDDAGTLTVDTPLTWTAGTGVGLPYFGSAPDLGAFESL